MVIIHIYIYNRKIDTRRAKYPFLLFPGKQSSKYTEMHKRKSFPRIEDNDNEKKSLSPFPTTFSSYLSNSFPPTLDAPFFPFLLDIRPWYFSRSVFANSDAASAQSSQSNLPVLSSLPSLTREFAIPFVSRNSFRIHTRNGRFI